MAIKDKVKKAAKAIVKDEPKPKQSTTTTSTSTPTSQSTPTSTSNTVPTSTKAGAALATKSTAPTSIEMPKSNGKLATNVNGNGNSSNGIKTPKTPQDEAIAFFSSGADGQPVQVWELWLEDDGGPDEAKSVCPLSPSFFLLLLSLDEHRGYAFND